MISTELIDKTFTFLIENNVSIETINCIVKLLIADKFKHLDDISNKALCEIKIILENNKDDDFECVEKIIALFESMDIGIDYRHDFG